MSSRKTSLRSRAGAALIASPSATVSDAGTLRVAFAHRNIAMREMPECVELVESSGDFRMVAEFPGLEEEQFTARVYEWSGARE